MFHPSVNLLVRVFVLGGAILAAGLGWAYYEGYYSSYFSRVDVFREQPIMFSHKHHVDGLGLDCRYCHTSVEVSASAGIPPTHTCMSCHSQVWTEAPILEPVRASYRTGKPLEWVRVHDLPDFVYFNHSIHVKKGIGCTTCHGQVDQMPLMRQVNTLFMGWCLECHRSPEKFVRPRDQVFSTDWQPPSNQLEVGRQLVEEYNIQSKTYCSACHR
ncbi:MAG: cytochrome c3 family protein [Acidobacteriota bacterium]|nr:MAG: cytochrome c3 family protein [Acidobacteriota bacterium]